jgi:exosome complex component RRP42
LDKLCIKKGEKVWTVFVDIYTINSDGNLLDAAAIATLVALRNTKIPKYDKKEEKVLYGEWTDEGLPLRKDIPLPCTIYKIGKAFVVDPNREEEDASETRITISISNGDTVYAMQKGEEKEVSIKEFEEILELAEKNYKQLFPVLEKHLK